MGQWAYGLMTGIILGACTFAAGEAISGKWQPNITDARLITINEARDAEGKVAWAAELRYGSNWPERYVAKTNELGKLCERFANQKGGGK